MGLLQTHAETDQWPLLDHAGEGERETCVMVCGRMWEGKRKRETCVMVCRRMRERKSCVEGGKEKEGELCWL